MVGVELDLPDNQINIVWLHFLFRRALLNVKDI